jgi:UDP-glucose 4-epimerase
MRVIVTGGAGFIGANLCRALSAEGHEVTAFDDLSTGREDNLDGVAGVKLVVGSFLDRDTLGEVVDGAGAVVHLGARPSVPKSVLDPMLSHDINVNGTMNVLEACRAQATLPHVVFASSSSVYGANPTLPKHESLACLPRSPYAASKLAGESYALSYQSSYGMPVLAFRFFNVFGPLQRPDHAYAAVVPAFVTAALHGQPLPIHGDGRQTRDFTFVGTVCEVITKAVGSTTTSPTPVNLAFGTRTSLLEVVHRLETILDMPLERHHTDPRAGDVRDSQADNGALRSLFPDVTPVSLDDGLQRYVDWARTLA